MSSSKLWLQVALLTMAAVFLVGQVILPFTDEGRIGGFSALIIGAVSVIMFTIAYGTPPRWEFLSLSGALFALAYVTTQGPDLQGGWYIPIQILLPLVAGLAGVAASVLGWRKSKA